MTAAFQDAGLFPPLVIRMLKIGEATGKLEVALANVTYFYNREVNEGVGKAQAALQPLLTLILGLVLLWVMFAVLGPVYDTISKMKF
jgi:type IV pilus assembly protein PilC